MTLRSLQRFNAVDMDQRAKNDAVRFRKRNRHSRPGKGHILGVSHFVGFAIGQPQYERIERSPMKQVLDRVQIHTSHDILPDASEN